MASTLHTVPESMSRFGSPPSLVRFSGACAFHAAGLPPCDPASAPVEVVCASRDAPDAVAAVGDWLRPHGYVFETFRSPEGHLGARTTGGEGGPEVLLSGVDDAFLVPALPASLSLESLSALRLRALSLESGAFPGEISDGVFSPASPRLLCHAYALRALSDAGASPALAFHQARAGFHAGGPLGASRFRRCLDVLSRIGAAEPWVAAYRDVAPRLPSGWPVDYVEAAASVPRNRPILRLAALGALIVAFDAARLDAPSHAKVRAGARCAERATRALRGHNLSSPAHLSSACAVPDLFEFGVGTCAVRSGEHLVTVGGVEAVAVGLWGRGSEPRDLETLLSLDAGDARELAFAETARVDPVAPDSARPLRASILSARAVGEGISLFASDLSRALGSDHPSLVGGVVPRDALSRSYAQAFRSQGLYPSSRKSLHSLD